MPVPASPNRDREARRTAVHTRGVGSVTRHHFVRRDDVPQVLRHLRAVFDHHALGEQALHRFVVFHQAHVAHEFRPEARIDQVEDGVLDSANVLIDGKPVSDLGGVERRLVVLARRRSGRNTTTNRRRCPWCRSRGAPGLRILDKSCSETPAHSPAAIRPRA
jgi:hypothetical protein